MRLFFCVLLLFLNGCIELEQNAQKNQVVGNIVTLDWTIPTRLEDESIIDIDEVVTYYIHWGDEATNLNNVEAVMAIDNKLVLTGLPKGKYFFTVSAETTSGNRSLPSNIVNKEFK